MRPVLLAMAMTLIGSMAYAQPSNWGQEVKACNESNCYPGGTSRGGYVRDQARDDEGPGYASEIHRFANPGKSDPNGRKF